MAEPDKDPAPDAPAPDEAQSQTITCPSCGSVFERRTLAETCRHEPGQGYRCAQCNHVLEREAADA